MSEYSEVIPGIFLNSLQKLVLSTFLQSKSMVQRSWLYIWQQVYLVVCLKPWALTMHSLLIVEER